MLGIDQTTVQGHPAINVESAYLVEPSVGGATNIMPGLMHNVDTVVQSGDNFYIMSFAVESSRFDDVKVAHDKLLSNWRIP